MDSTRTSNLTDLAAQAALVVEPGTGGAGEVASNNPRSLMEAILAQKMARASAKFMRSTSTTSIDSTCSAKSNSTDTQGLSQQCKCDDCLLGITDILAEVALLNLKIQRTTCTSPKNGSEDRITGEDCGDNCCTNYPQNGGDDTDCNVLIRKPSGWRKVRNMVQWTPFIQTFKNRKYQWVQLAGHSGNFKAGRSQGTVLKKLCPQEENCYTQFSSDSLKEYVPEFQGTLVLDNDEKFIQLQDCLSSFVKPSIMDCKIGVRTYLEEELAKAKEKPKLRKDMFEKMTAVDPLAPTEEEKRLKGVTKPRYMVWRETISSTATLGFRIEGVKKCDGTSSKEFKTTKTRDQVMDTLSDFISSSSITANQYLERLKAIRKALNTSLFFKTHELIGSSLLFVHDSEKACIWLIDFGKTVPLPSGLNIDHKSPWVVGNHEDGYLIGIDNLISIYTSLVAKLESSSSPIPIDDEPK